MYLYDSEKSHCTISGFKFGINGKNGAMGFFSELPKLEGLLAD
jgi:hypothetical protein